MRALQQTGRIVALAAVAVACGKSASHPARIWECSIHVDDSPDFAEVIGCDADFLALASRPIDASIPGARSTKTVIDRYDGNALYFQNSVKYPIHWEFTRQHLSGRGKPIVGSLSQFNEVEYTSPDRRFVLGAVSYYEGPQAWVYEIAPYDTASASMISNAYATIAASAFFGGELWFHPTSEAVATAAQELAGSVPVMTTEELFRSIDYQPLNLGTSYGKLRVLTVERLDVEYVNFQDIVVLDRVPNDISVVMGIITAAYQTPLAHINVLSQNRGTPNMALRNAPERFEIRSLDGQWVRLEVGAFDYSIVETTRAQADAWWETHRPSVVQVPDLDLSVTDLTDMADLLDPALELRQSLRRSIPAFGGKASHYAALAQIPDVPSPKAFAVPVAYYRQFMEENGFDALVDAMLEDQAFRDDPAVRNARLHELREAMKVAPVDAAFEEMLMLKLQTDYPGQRMRFRSSTNAEDLEGFTGAGLYTSKSGDPLDPTRPVLDAVRKVWASIWFFRAFEERRYRGIDHRRVGMALLVHHSFPDEEANGVALTANPYDTSGLEPGFYVNVQVGETSVVQPNPGIKTDQFIYQYDLPGQPIIFQSHSNLVRQGQTVLTRAQTHELGTALKAIHLFFARAYGPSPDHPERWYAMDVEFKFDDLKRPGEPAGEPTLWVKQARPHPGWGEE